MITFLENGLHKNSDYSLYSSFFKDFDYAKLYSFYWYWLWTAFINKKIAILSD